MSMYIILFSHEDYNGANIIPSNDIAPRRVYSSIDAAENALQTLIGELKNFTPTLYGEAFPFENTTARDELATKGRAVYGWTKDVTEDGEIIQYGIYIDTLSFEQR
jgi:hypothetical protein